MKESSPSALWRLVGGGLVALLVVGLFNAPTVSAVDPLNAIIDNGTVQLGVWNTGELNAPGGTPSSEVGTTDVGLRYLPTNAESTAPGCLCEGWGVADATTLVAGYANQAYGGAINLTPVSFTVDGSSAVSVVDVAASMRVTHAYRPSPETAFLYQVDVAVQNLSGDPIDLRYRRVMDWDIEPTAFNEYTTIQGGAGAADVLFTSNDGFADANPLAGESSIGGLTGDFLNEGPADHGALFDFAFGALAPGATKEFTTFYGAAGNETDALAALGAVGAEVYSFGQPSSSPPDVGEPNTFIFAFAGVGGDPVVPPTTVPPTTVPPTTVPPTTVPPTTVPPTTVPPVGDEWCSPGYWKSNPLATAATGVDMNQKYLGTGGPALTKPKRGASSNPTLQQVLDRPDLYGGPAGNHVADLLSRAHPSVSFAGVRASDCPLRADASIR